MDGLRSGLKDEGKEKEMGCDVIIQMEKGEVSPTLGLRFGIGGQTSPMSVTPGTYRVPCLI